MAETNGMIKDVFDVDCSDCQHKDVCKFRDNAGDFLKSIRGTYTESGSNPFVITVSCTHKKKEVPTSKVGARVGVELVGGNPTIPAVRGVDLSGDDGIIRVQTDTSSDKTDGSKIVTRKLK